MSNSLTGYAVQLEGVCKRYPHFALEQVDLRVARGSIMGFLGANGAGKSTTIRILMGLLRAEQGKVGVLGLQMPAAQREIKQQTGYVSDDLRLYGHATLDWHMAFVAQAFGQWDDAYAAHLARAFDLNPLQKIKGMSHGQRVKAALLLVLARRPRLLVLDEPTTGLDPVARHEVIAALMEVMRDEERTILFSSHNTQEVEQIADSITFIDRGRIVDADDKESYLERWRRIRLELAPGMLLPAVPGTFGAAGKGRLQVLTTDCFTPAMAQALTASGAQLHAVDSMSLEEIFVSNVLRKRGENASCETI